MKKTNIKQNKNGKTENKNKNKYIDIFQNYA